MLPQHARHQGENEPLKFENRPDLPPVYPMENERCRGIPKLTERVRVQLTHCLVGESLPAREIKFPQRWLHMEFRVDSIVGQNLFNQCGGLHGSLERAGIDCFNHFSSQSNGSLLGTPDTMLSKSARRTTALEALRLIQIALPVTQYPHAGRFR